MQGIGLSLFQAVVSIRKSSAFFLLITYSLIHAVTTAVVLLHGLRLTTPSRTFFLLLLVAVVVELITMTLLVVRFTQADPSVSVAN